MFTTFYRGPLQHAEQIRPEKHNDETYQFTIETTPMRFQRKKIDIQFQQINSTMTVTNLIQFTIQDWL